MPACQSLPFVQRGSPSEELIRVCIAQESVHDGSVVSLSNGHLITCAGRETFSIRAH